MVACHLSWLCPRGPYLPSSDTASGDSPTAPAQGVKARGKATQWPQRAPASPWVSEHPHAPPASAHVPSQRITPAR